MTMKTSDESATHVQSTRPVLVLFAWLAVGLPLLWGIAQTVSKAAALFR